MCPLKTSSQDDELDSCPKCGSFHVMTGANESDIACYDCGEGLPDENEPDSPLSGFFQLFLFFSSIVGIGLFMAKDFSDWVVVGAVVGALVGIKAVWDDGYFTLTNLIISPLWIGGIGALAGAAIGWIVIER